MKYPYLYQRLYPVLSRVLLEASLSYKESLEILDIDKEQASDANSLKKAYYKAAKENHPDSGGSEEEMKLVNEAFEFLQSEVPKFEVEVPEPKIDINGKLYTFEEFAKTKNLKIDGDLEIEYIGTSIKELPQDLTVSGSFSLYGPQINKLPQGLKVGKRLDLGNTQVTEIPSDLKAKVILARKGQVKVNPNNIRIVFKQ